MPEIEELATVVVCEDDDPTRELLVLVFDLRLPDAGGIDVLREIRGADGASGRFDPSLPVIVLSGRGSEADRLRGFAAGAATWSTLLRQAELTTPLHPGPGGWEGHDRPARSASGSVDNGANRSRLAAASRESNV